MFRPISAVELDPTDEDALFIGRTCTKIKNGKYWNGKWESYESLLGQLANNHGESGPDHVKLPGKIHPAHKCCYVGFQNAEFCFRELVIL